MVDSTRLRGISDGTVYWFTGLSGAGKTTIGKLFASRLRELHHAVVFLDGDVLREVFGNDLGHSPDDRLKSAMRNSRLCRVLGDQGIDVVCATISMFEQVRAWNRANLRRYREVYLRVPMELLVLRDQKQLYSRAQRGEIRHVMGIDIPLDEPLDADLVMDNDGNRTPDEVTDLIWSAFEPWSPEGRSRCS